MRCEKEMYDLILGYANADENIRAVILNGSRANPNRKPDPFNDFDIVYLVRDLTPCKEKAYYKDFGEILVCERTDESELFKEHFPEFVCYLMQFADGNRIDLAASRDNPNLCSASLPLAAAHPAGAAAADPPAWQAAIC